MVRVKKAFFVSSKDLVVGVILTTNVKYGLLNNNFQLNSREMKRMTKSSKCATAFMLTLLASMIVIALAPAIVNAQTANQEHVIVPASVGGTTNPPAGDYFYGSNTLVTIKATPDANYTFLYWLITGSGTTGTMIPPADLPTLAPDQTLPPDVADGSIFGRPPYEYVTGDNYISTLNPIIISCQAGYTFSYQAVFSPTGALPTPVPTATPAPTPTPTSQATSTPTSSIGPTPTIPEFSSAALVLVVAAIAIVSLCTVAYKRRK